MNAITPLAITTDVLIYSNVSEEEYDEWAADTAYAVGDIVQVTSEISGHSIYECTSIVTSGLASDILNEDCDSSPLDSSSGGRITVSPAGYWLLTCTSLLGYASSFHAYSSASTTTTIEIALYLDKIGTTISDGFIIDLAYNNVLRFQACLTSNGMYIAKAGGVFAFAFNTVKCNSFAAWQHWRFEIDLTGGASAATVEVFLKESDGVWASQGTYDCNDNGDYGTSLLRYYLYGLNNYCHINSIKGATGLGIISSTDDTPVNNVGWTKLSATNRWKPFDNILNDQISHIDSIQNIFKMPANNVYDSLSILNHEITSVEIFGYNINDNAVINNELSGAGTDSPTGPPTSWDEVGDTACNFTTGYDYLWIFAITAGSGLSQTETVKAETLYNFTVAYVNYMEIGQFSIYDMSNAAYLVPLTDLPGDVTYGTDKEFYVCNHSISFTTPVGCTSIKLSFVGKVGGFLKNFGIMPDSVVISEITYPVTTTANLESKTDTIIYDLPTEEGQVLSVTLYNTETGVPKAGEIILGTKNTIADMLFTPTVSISDYSTKEQDTFGNWTIVKRAYSKKLDLRMSIANTDIDRVFKLLSDKRSELQVWVGDVNYQCTIVYGYYSDFSITIPGPQYSECTLEIEGMI